MIANSNVGFIGLGAMGYGMALRLSKEGYSVRGFDVFPAAVERYKNSGGEVAHTLLEAAEAAHHLVCMVATASQAQDVLFQQGVVKALPNGSILYLCATVPSTYAISVEAQLRELGREDVLFIDCPVSGGAARAAAGTLTIMAGGSSDSLEKGRQLLQTLGDGDKLFMLPNGPGSGSNMKMVHQVLAGCHILASCEVMGFAARLGVHAEDVLKQVQCSDAWAWMVENRIPRFIQEDFTPAVSALAIILKDIGIITTMARHASVPTPFSSFIEQHFVYALGLEGGSGRDDASLIRMYYPEPVKTVRKPIESHQLSELSDLDLVIRLLRIILLLSIAEAVGLAHRLGVDVNTFYKLAVNASGGSRMVEKYTLPMHSFLTGALDTDMSDGNVDALIQEINIILAAARKVECPLYMGAQAATSLMIVKNLGYGAAGLASVASLWLRK